MKKSYAALRNFIFIAFLPMLLMSCSDGGSRYLNFSAKLFAVSVISGSTTESGGTATFTVALTTQPKADVTIGISSSDTTEGTVSLSSLVFTPVNWEESQTVTVTGVDDNEVDGDVAYTIILAEAVSDDSNYNGKKPNDVSVINIDDDLKLPDTGQTSCYDAAGNIISCPPVGDPLAQDGSYQMHQPFYTDNGDGTITDINTKLMWQREDDDTIRTWEAAGTYCSNLTLAGHNDWRLPNPKELQSIVDYEPYDPAINQTVFPGTITSSYWSSTTYAGNTDDAWGVYFGNGGVIHYGKSDSYYVRCVRAGSESDIWSMDFSVIDVDTVEHLSTGLVWQREDDNVIRTWEAALSYCEGLSLSGNTDWRLPNIRELQSILDYTTAFPTINPTLFPGTDSSFYWSSTTYAGNTYYAWVVAFGHGDVGNYDKSGSYYVRCVRGGQ